MRLSHASVVWVALAISIAVPLAAAATSPLIAWRDPVYVVGGFAGVVALCLLLLQPLLAGGRLPGLPVSRGRRIHRMIGMGLVGMVVVHVAGLWITSPPDVIDALMFRSPTLFSVWGVIAMWALFGAALLALLRRRLRPGSWRKAHAALAGITVLGSVAHAILIEGTMETVSKIVLCLLVLLSAGTMVTRFRGRAQG